MRAVGAIPTARSSSNGASHMRSRGGFLAHYRREQLRALDDDHFARIHDSFLRELSIMGEDGLDEAERSFHAAFFSLSQKRYLAIKERRATERLLSLGRGADLPVEAVLDGFDRSAYERVRDLKVLVDFRTCRTVVMVGSGAFPATLLWLRDHFPELCYCGLDIDPECVAMANKLATSIGADNMRFILADGTAYGFDGADFVYIANHVVPKRGVLEQIARNPSVRQVVVREPTRHGELLAETVRYNLPDAFIIAAAGEESGQFLSYDLALRRA
jgi:hypothetical protein